MSINQLNRLCDKLPDFEKIVRDLNSKTPKHALLEGLAPPTKGFVLSRLFARLNKTLLIVTPLHESAMKLWEDLTRNGVREDDLAVLPSLPSIFLEGDVADYRAMGERIGALCKLSGSEPCIVIGSIDAVMQRTAPPHDLLPHQFSIEAGSEIDLDKLTRHLVEIGYSATTTVTRPGEFSRRGGIIDLYPGAADGPVRIELFGDEIETIRPFDVATQRSTGKVARIDVTPAREIRLTDERILRALEIIELQFEQRKSELAKEGTTLAREAIDRLTHRVERDIAAISQSAYVDGIEDYLPYLSLGTHTALDYLKDGAVLILDEPSQCADRFERHSGETQQSRERYHSRGQILSLAPHAAPLSVMAEQSALSPLLSMSLLGRMPDGFPKSTTYSIHSAQAESFRGRLNDLADEIQTWLNNDCRVVLVSDQPHRVREICNDLKLPLQPRERKPEEGNGLYVVDGRMRVGFKITDLRLYLLTDAEMFGSVRPPIARRKIAGGIAISSVLDLQPEDFVVHIHHGVGRYRGLIQRTVEDAQKDYLLVEYSGGDRLFIPADQIDRIQRYVGTDGAPPQVNKIGGQEWQRTKRKVKEQAKQMAGELIRLYAARQQATRPSFGEDSGWQAELEEAFPYQETRDQLKAINDVKSDLENQRPMDRLVCGDVGFGKTEVALRGVFKVVTAGRQVAILCPTTVLAAQHFQSFSERFAAYPLKIELLSRFRTPQQNKKTVQGLKDGTVDIVIGTHRLLSKDVTFKDLGLIVVDEEQRFGVSHKERLKQMRTQVDVLTLSATPIPRTLSMALSGLRDMSVIGEAPPGRLPVQTVVREYDEEIVRDAIARELERQGQIYFVHNRVESIYHVAERLRKLSPEARIVVGHGQMGEEELQEVMYKFYNYEADILLCTTIVENGLDVSNANTILIDNSDHFGLSQLYQLRGRVGRSPRQAYAYLLFRRNKQLSEVAERRLSAMKEFAQLGSGYKVAMRDLEIRGAGNLLGAEQSGAMVSVGFDLYCQLIANAVQELRGEEVVEDILPAMDLPITAMIPEDYITGEAERIFFYKKMSGVRSEADIANLQAEFEDRFGDPPKPVWDALAILRMRVSCKHLGISQVKAENAKLNVRFSTNFRISPEAIKLLTVVLKGVTYVGDGLTLPITTPNILQFTEDTLATLEKAIKHKHVAQTPKRSLAGAVRR